MAYQFADGFDNYGNGTTLVAGYPWDSVVSNTTTTADFQFAPPGSLPGGSLTLNTTGTLRKNLSSNQSTIIIGFAFKYVSNLPSSQAEIFSVGDTGTEQCSLVCNSTGALQFFRGQTTTAIGTQTAPGVISSGAWFTVAAQIVVGTGTSGSVLLYINGAATPTISNAGLNTAQTGNSFANQVSIGGSLNGGQNSMRFDDFYCFDNTGPTLNTIPSGPTRILTKMPSSAGNYTNWTPVGLGTNWQNAAVLPPSTSDYNANNVSTTKDSYTTQLAGLGVAPLFVMARASLERDDAGPHTPSLFVRSGTTDSAGVVTPAIGASYLYYDAVFATDPATSVAWTGGAADAAQVGIIEG